MISSIPNHRIFDERDRVLCSKNPDFVAKILASHNFPVHYCLLTGEMNSFPIMPLITEETLVKKFSDSLLLLDGDCGFSQSKRQELQQRGIEILDLSSLEQSYPHVPIQCASNNLYIDDSGAIYPCPRMIDREPIALIWENDCVDKLRNYDPGFCSCKRGFAVRSREPLSIQNISIEFGGACPGRCVYCYELTKRPQRAHYPFHQLKRFLESVEFRGITVAGGEVMIQPETLSFVEQLKDLFPQVSFGLKTNGHSENPEIANSLFDNILVSINAFSDSALRLIMGDHVRLDTIVSFCEAIAAESPDKLSLKFLLTPMSLGDLSRFLLWAVKLNPAEISVTKAMVFGDESNRCRTGSSFYGLNRAYWDDIIARAAKDASEALRQADEKNTRIRFGQGVDKLLFG